MVNIESTHNTGHAIMIIIKTQDTDTQTATTFVIGHTTSAVDAVEWLLMYNDDLDLAEATIKTIQEYTEDDAELLSEMERKLEQMKWNVCTKTTEYNLLRDKIWILKQKYETTVEFDANIHRY